MHRRGDDRRGLRRVARLRHVGQEQRARRMDGVRAAAAAPRSPARTYVGGTVAGAAAAARPRPRAAATFQPNWRRRPVSWVGLGHAGAAGGCSRWRPGIVRQHRHRRADHAQLRIERDAVQTRRARPGVDLAQGVGAGVGCEDVVDGLWRARWRQQVICPATAKAKKATEGVAVLAQVDGSPPDGRGAAVASTSPRKSAALIAWVPRRAMSRAWAGQAAAAARAAVRLKGSCGTTDTFPKTVKLEAVAPSARQPFNGAAFSADSVADWGARPHRASKSPRRGHCRRRRTSAALVWAFAVSDWRWSRTRASPKRGNMPQACAVTAGRCRARWQSMPARRGRMKDLCGQPLACSVARTGGDEVDVGRPAQPRRSATVRWQPLLRTNRTQKSALADRNRADRPHR